MSSNTRTFTFIEPATYYSTGFINIIPNNFDDSVKRNNTLVANKVVLVSKSSNLIDSQKWFFYFN